MKPTLAPSTDRRPLSEQVADAVLEWVLDQHLRPGDRLPTEPELIDMFGVSRTVVREASRTLIARGVVDVRPRRGMTVAEFDHRNLARQVALIMRLGGGTFEQLMEMRKSMEPDMTSLAAARRSPQDVANLEELVERIHPSHAISTADERRAQIDADLGFHLAIAHATGNPFFIHTTSSFNEILLDTYVESTGYAPERAKTHEEHRAIARAIAEGDAAKASALAAEHIARVSDAALILTDTVTDADGAGIEPTEHLEERR